MTDEENPSNQLYPTVRPEHPPEYWTIKKLEAQIAVLKEHNAQLTKMIQNAPSFFVAEMLPAFLRVLDLVGYLEHKDAVALFRLGDKTKKEESKFMEGIRRRFDTAAKGGRHGWRYPAIKMVAIAMALDAVGRKEGEDPTPEQIEAARRAIQAGILRIHSPTHPPNNNENA